MQLTSFQVSTLKKLLSEELPLAALCDSPEGESLCWSGLVGLQAPKRGIRATVVISEQGRAALQGVNV